MGENFSKFKGKLVKMIKDSGGKFDDYSISLKIREILLHWVYELNEKDFLPTQQINWKRFFFFNTNHELLSTQ